MSTDAFAYSASGVALRFWSRLIAFVVAFCVLQTAAEIYVFLSRLEWAYDCGYSEQAQQVCHADTKRATAGTRFVLTSCGYEDSHRTRRLLSRP